MKKFFSNTAVMVILAILAVAGIAAAVYINIQVGAKQTLINNTKRSGETVISSESSTEMTASTDKVDKDSQERELNDLLSKMESITNSQKDITDIIDKYIDVRYNYSDGPDKQHILNELSGIVRKFYLGQVDNSLNYLTGDSKATVVKRYASNYGHPSSTTYVDNDITTFVYIVNINDVNKVIEYTMFKESGKWVIYNERELGTVEDKDLQTEELITPDVIKPSETENTDINSETNPASKETEVPKK